MSTSNCQSLIEHSIDAIIALDGDGRIIDANPAAEALFGQSAKKLAGKRLDYPLDDDTDVIIDRSDGQIVAKTRTVPIKGAGRWVILHDVTDLHRKHQRLRQALKMEAVGRLTAGVAHDFNNKLTIISGFTRVGLSQVDQDAPLHESLTEVARAAEQSAEMIQQLLTLSRPQPADLKPTGLNDLVAEMAPSLEKLLGDHVDFVVEAGHDVGAVLVDPVQLEQAVTNLAANARDAMDGSGKLTVTTRSAHIHEHDTHAHTDAATGDHVVLTLTDTGCGMDEAIVRQIFEPFFTTKASGRGTGLGLAMVYGFVVGHDGHVRVHSTPGKGTTFELYFPCVGPVEHGDYQPTERPAEKEPAAHGSGEIILLAEDEPAVRTLLIRILQTCGYQVLAGADGAEALRKAQGLDRPVDLLITDVVMPNMCGRTLTDEMRKRQPDIPVVYISGYTHGIVD
ncbi:MAG: ATP-binding protein, partial [Planctomycetota bacterium]